MPCFWCRLTGTRSLPVAMGLVLVAYPGKAHDEPHDHVGVVVVGFRWGNLECVKRYKKYLFTLIGVIRGTITKKRILRVNLLAIRVFPPMVEKILWRRRRGYPPFET